MGAPLSEEKMSTLAPAEAAPPLPPLEGEGEGEEEEEEEEEGRTASSSPPTRAAPRTPLRGEKVSAGCSLSPLASHASPPLPEEEEEEEEEE